ncbi:hypothetical protein [Paracoccus sp. (in: a-proteobacteria)]|uniref:hypothetical protein n=1 Tax=Paracoccus sp. TaxID=267 RepID=UPI0026DF9A22|nr:hypothetical protein [Paracoccus sp. (in: a-proteobacteria)]MDO5369200.1 hypothetical protein [Paracoccus sp. (in: a-proteobacteria)]
MQRRARSGVALVLLLASGIAACSSPVPVAQAERLCLENARAATAPRTEIGLGLGTDGHKVRTMGGISVSLSSDYIRGRDPAVAFHDCVLRRSGQVPTRPLHEQPGYRWPQ